MMMIQLAIVGDSEPITPPPDAPKLRGDRIQSAIRWIDKLIEAYDGPGPGLYMLEMDVWDQCYFLDRITGTYVDCLTDDDLTVVERCIEQVYPGGLVRFNLDSNPMGDPFRTAYQRWWKQ